MIDFNLLLLLFLLLLLLFNLFIYLTLGASLSAALGTERGKPLAAENRKLSHIRRKKSNVTQFRFRI